MKRITFFLKKRKIRYVLMKVTQNERGARGREPRTQSHSVVNL